MFNRRALVYFLFYYFFLIFRKYIKFQPAFFFNEFSDAFFALVVVVRLVAFEGNSLRQQRCEPDERYGRKKNILLVVGAFK